MSVDFYISGWAHDHKEEHVFLLSSDFSLFSKVLGFESRGFISPYSISQGEIPLDALPNLRRDIIRLMNTGISDQIKVWPSHSKNFFDMGIPKKRIDFKLGTLLDLIAKAQSMEKAIYFG
jgi:hypothetical protein